MDERLKFVARLLDGESMSAMCREFGISRKTGYKIFNRCGLEGLQDQSRRPYRNANKLPFQVERSILHIKKERPHQALNMKYPGEVYTPSVRVYRPPEVPEYPYHDRTIVITKCGRICIGRRKINLSTVFTGQSIGIREVADKIWLVSFMDYDLGFFDEDESRVEPADNPFVPKVLPMSSV